MAVFIAILPGPTIANPPPVPSLQAKLDRLIIPEIQFFEVSLPEAVKYLNLKSRELDKAEPDLSARGITFHLADDLADSGVTIDLDLKRVPMRTVLGYITEFSGTGFTIKDNAVLVAARHNLMQELTCGTGEDWAPYKRKQRPPAKNVLQARAAARIFPRVQFVDASLEEAVGHLQRAIDSPCEFDPPIATNVLIKPGGNKSISINLDLKDISAWDALRYVALLADYDVRADSHALVLVPKPEK